MLKYVFIAFLIIVFVPSVRRFLFYLLVGRQLAKEQKRYAERTAPRREGDVRVDVKPQNRDSGFAGGEYVDYEEVK